MIKGLWQLMDRTTRVMSGALVVYWGIGLLVAFPILLAALMFFALCFPLAIIVQLIRPEAHGQPPATQPPARPEERNCPLTEAEERFIRALDGVSDKTNIVTDSTEWSCLRSNSTAPSQSPF
jgi:hypothetical protein